MDPHEFAFAEDFGQKVDLTQRIREVLANYPEGTTILKELIQNADDAGASRVSFCLDRRRHGTDSLAYGALAEWQGPALLAFNNATFVEEDFESISRIGDSKKRGQAWKTGRFGVGFNSVYHLSDLPSFVSGRYVVMFDPHCKFLPRVSSANPGKRIDFVSTGALKMYKDQFTPYCAFGCDMESPYSGTLFRFPLRSEVQAAVSSLSRQSYSEEDMQTLLQDLFSEGVNSMLFLKSVETLEIYEWGADMAEPQQLYTCRIQSPTAEIRWHRQAFTRLSRSPVVQPNDVGNHNDLYSLSFVSEVLVGPHQGEMETESFLIAQSMGLNGSRIRDLAENAKDHYDLHLLPWASVAAKIASSGFKAQEGVALEGQAFCFLPLPVKTGLPVQVNGYFELSSNRRDIWYGADMDRAGKLRSDWNRCLLEDVVAQAFSALLVEARKQLGHVAVYDSLWPCGSFVEPWLTMVKRFYTIASELALLYTDAGSGRWITPKQALYHDEEFSDAEGLAGALTAEGLPLVRLNTSLRDTLFTFCVAKPRMVLPRLVRAQFCKPGKHDGLAERSHALVVLDYCLEDVIDDEASDALLGLPLIPLANGTLGVFGKRNDADVFLICTDIEYRLLESLPDKLVDQTIGKNLIERLSSIATLSGSNLTRLSGTVLVQLLGRLLPPNWKGMEEVEWKPESNPSHPSEEWLNRLWQYLQQSCKELSVFRDWPLLPTTSGCLCKLQTQSKIIRSGVWTPSLESILSKVGCRVLRSDLGIEHPSLSTYVHDGTAAGVVDTIFSAASQDSQQLTRAFDALDGVDGRELREYFCDAKWYAGDEMNEERLKVLRAFPIFEVHPGTDSRVKIINVDLVRSKLFLAPLGMHESLLSPEFLRTYSDRELEWLAGPLKVKRLERTIFYKWRVFNRLHEISPEVRDSMMLSILRELPQLAATDSSFREAMKQLAFVPTRSSDTLQMPKSLYDPRGPELTALLDDQDCFPAGIFLSEEALQMLQGLGLRVAVSPETVLQSARQVEALSSNDAERAHKKGQELLSYLELNAVRWLPQRSTSDDKAIGRMFQKVSTIFQSPDMASDETLNRFWHDLANLSWCPVLMHPPHPNLPWPSAGSSVAPPKHIALKEDMWLVSASMRVLDGECSRASVLASKLGWSARQSGRRLAAQLLELGKNHVVVQDLALGQALATVVPRIYTLLTEMLGSDEVDIVKAVLEGSRWVWVGDGFANVQEVAFSGPLHLAPFLRIIPADLAAFKELLLELGVRETLTPNEFAFVLSNMAKDKQGASLDPQQLSAAVWLVQHLADLHFNLQGVVAYVPDANSVLVPALELVYNDAPWLHSSERGSISSTLTGPTTPVKGPRFVHAKISSDVAERLGVRSLRRMLLAESADSMDLGLHNAAEAFGQHEALTTRLKHIVEMYSDGPGILCELVQNADDAGAREVSFLLDRSEFGTSSVLSPRMADWQGPALYCQNDSVFTPRDLYAISRIGQDSKLERPSAIGRFGLGFNSVYHFTDIPGFISGSNLVIFDPHACNLPGVTPSHPGLKISFVGRGLLEQFPDQLRPYLMFGCDVQRPYPGTLFRFPLRTEKTAASSEIKQGAYTPEDVVDLFWSFKNSAEEAVLFLRNVASVSVYVRDSPDQDMELLYQVKRPVTTMQSPVYEFVRGNPQNPIDKEQFYRNLTKTPSGQLPWQCQTVEVSLTVDGVQQAQKWLISAAMGGGRARDQAVAPENRPRGFIPWAGIAAPLQENQPKMGLIKEMVESHQDEQVIERSETTGRFEGRAFCFLPLPVKIGLPVHVNGYFELSSNRRDIWYGDDMAGGGKLRANWNRCLLEDVAAPAYARLLVEAARELGATARFYALWPTGSVHEPWYSLLRQLYKSVVDLDLPVVYTNAAQGKWVSPKRAVFPDNGFAEASELSDALAHAGLPIINAPAAVIAKFRELCPYLRYLTPSMLRRSIAGTRRTLEGLSANVLALKYCLSDVEEADAGATLQGLSLVPLCNGSLATIALAGRGERLIVATGDESLLLEKAVPYMLVDCGIAKDVFETLHKIAQRGGTNMTTLTGPVLEELLPRLIPAEWRSKGVVTWVAGDESFPSLDWMQLLWKFLNSSCTDLSVFGEWPLLPTSDGRLIRLVKNSRVIRDEGWSENMVSALQKAGCAILRTDMQVQHPSLGEYVHDASAFGVLDSFRAAAGGHLPALAHVLRDASDGERRELRSFLCQSKWFASGKLNASHTEVLRSLPIFESYSSSGRRFTDLPQGKRFFPPLGVSEELLGENFIRAESQKEEEVLAGSLGVTKLSRAIFYRDHLFINMAHIPEAVLIRSMLAAIQDYSKLVEEDPALASIMSSLPFVPTAQGALEAPERLYDPRIPELQTLLNIDAFFPSGDFATDAVLDTLVDLGLRRTLGYSGLLDSARSVAMISSLNHSEALQRAKALLAYLDKLQIARETDGAASGSDRLLHSMAVGIAVTDVGVKDDGAESEFWLQLVNINWCPVLTCAPDDKLPWQQVTSPIAPPLLVRPDSQMWLVSATMFILDGDIRSATLATKLGWEEDPNATVLAAQLVQLSRQHSKWQHSLISKPEALLEINAALDKEIPHIYKLLQEKAGSKELIQVQEVLAGMPWVWVGEGFVLPKQLAFDSPAHFHPYLHIVPSEIVKFRKLLTTFGVRETFEAADYVVVLHRIAQDMKGGVLSQEQRTFCLRVLEALSEALPVSKDSNAILASVVMPDDSGILAFAKDLIYNDAAWLAKSASGMIGMRRFVHPDIDNRLAERLGAKSLRYLSLVDQEMTSTLPCPDTSSISDLLSKKEDRNLLMFDLLEIADCCKARKVHLMYDKREHPRQSLLQPNLGSFQGPALTVAFEGAALSAEEVCSLQTSLPAKLRGQFCQYGTGLLGVYHVTELLFVVSSACLYLFDPPGQVLAASPNDGQAGASGGMPVGKAFSLKGTDLAQRFSDQFCPLQISSSLSWARTDATIMRLPLRSEEQAANAKFGAAEECRDADIAAILDNFKSRASSALLFLKTVEDVSVTAWEEGEAAPHGLFAVRVDPARALLRNPFQEKKWRNFKYQLTSIFGGSSTASKVHTIDILLTEDGTQLVDKWLVVQCLGSGRTRDMALDRKFLSYDLTPIGGVAAHMSRNGSIPDVDVGSSVLAPLPVPVVTGLPVTIMGNFMISHGITRHLFKSLTPPELPSSTDRSFAGSGISADVVAAAWNKELLACVRDSYIELLQELQRLRQDPSTSRADPPIGRGLDGTYGVPVGRAYFFWPRSRAGLNQPAAVEGQYLAEWLIKPMYARLVEMPMWQLHGGAMAKATEGMFLLPPGAERQGMVPPATVCEFLKTHYRVFAVPYELTKEMEAAGVSAKELTPRMLRSLLKLPAVAAAVPSVVTQVDLLEFCCTDLHKEESTSVETGQIENLGTRTNPTVIPSVRGSPSGPQQVITNARLRPHGVQPQGQFEPWPPSRAPDGRDPLEWFSDIGRALADYGAGVISDIGRDEQTVSNSASRADESSTLDKALVLDLKGLMCPTAKNHMSKLGTTELWVGSQEQQNLLPGLASRFVHALCVERTVLADLFNDRVFQSLLKLKPFSSQVLAANLGFVLPKHWVPRGAVTAAAPWVGWTMDPANGPTAEWLRMLWKNINLTSSEELTLFSQWPLIPAVTSSPVLVRVGQRQVVFVPPVPRMELPGPHGGDGNAPPADIELDGITRGYLELERHHPWLLQLLRNCNVPVYDRRFLDCSIVNVCKPPPEKSLPQAVVAIFLALQQVGCLSPSDLAFTPADCDALFNLFASCTPALAFNSEELTMLRMLPIYKTRTGTFVTLDQQMHCIVPPNMFLQPDDDLCLKYRESSEGGTLYQALGISVLADHEVMARFALPGFESQPEREQERILAYLLNNWSSQKQHENLIAVLSDTKFIKNLAGDSILYRPSDLMDPESTLLKRIFADESSKFPGGQFTTTGWLVILRVAGLRSGIDPPLLLECAKKVEELGKDSSRQRAEQVDDFDSESAGNNGVSSELWTTAGMLTDALLSSFASVYGTNFCEALGRIAFVPAERGIPSIGGSSGGRKVLAAYSEAVLVKDWPLAWTCAPILARSAVVPPEFSWGAFRLRHPPPFAIVVKHLKVVGRNGGEDILARWPNGKGMRSVEDVFGDVLKYLTSTWDGLSASDKDALRALQIIPVANGTRLAAAGSLFARLGMDLAPFVFELPSGYLAYVDVLTSLGMKDSPTFESMRALLVQLQRTCGYQRLNPNELQAVLRILSFICDKTNRVKSMTSRVLPDPAVDAVVPDDSGRLLQGKACVYVDSAGLTLVGEIDSARVRFVHPHVPEQICVELGVRKLSEVIVEELDDNRSLEMLDSIDGFTRSSIADRLRSSPFAEAMWAVVQEASDGVPALKSALSKEKLAKVMGFAADGLWFVRRLYTRFLMLPARVDVTRRYKKPPTSLMNDNDDGGDTGHRVFEYVDRARSRVLVAAPSQGVTLPDLLAVVLSRLLGSPVSLPVGALFTAPLGSHFAALNVLRLGLTASNRGAKNVMANSGVLGMELVGADAVLVQCHPLRPFHSGELVAWRPDEQGGLRYGRVLHDVRASAGQALYRLEVETGSNEIRFLLSSQVLSFKGTAAAAAATTATPIDSEDVEEAISSIKNALEPVNGNPSSSESTLADVSQLQESSESSGGQAAGNVSTAEVVRAVRDMLTAAGLPMGADQISLLEHSLTLQEQLTAVDTALIEEQRRAEAAVKEAEAARTAWTCRVCLTSEVDTIVIPCGHVLCQNCSTAVSRCPFCRRPVTKSQRLYRP